MVRVQVQLTEEQIRGLKRLSLDQGVSLAEMIRRGVEQQLRTQSIPARSLHLERLRERVKQFRSGIDDLATQHDRYLNEAFGHNGDVR